MTLALKLPERLPLGFDLVSASAYVEVTEADFIAIRKQAGFNKPDADAHFGSDVVVGGTTLALDASVGVHDYRRDEDFEELTETGFIVHYSLELEAGIQAGKTDDVWGKLSDAVANVVAKHECRVRLQQFLPPGKIVPATSLPIQLGESVSGFTEIRGVRLAQPDTDTKKELYAVILQLTSDGGYSMSTLTGIESRLDGELLTKAINRLAEISGLVYKEVQAQ